jgi:hypothetical protein
MANKLVFKDAEEAKKSIIVEQQREIAKLYEDWADDIAKQAEYYSHKFSSSAYVSERYYKQLRRQLRKTSQEVSNEIYNKIKSNMYLISDEVVKSNVKWLKSFGFSEEGLNATFSYVPKDTVERLVTGQIYKSGWSLSKRIWGDNEQTLKDIYQVMAKGIAEQKPIYDIAKDLESYVRPNARLPWNLRMADGVRIYKKQVDYNAQRLARTLVQHSYQQSFISTTKDNPFVLDYVWRANGSRVCELCMSRDGVHYKKDDLPLDHPNGMCVIEPSIDKDMNEKLADWFNSPDGTYPEIDEFASNFGYEAKPIKSVKDYLDKYGNSTRSMNAWYQGMTHIQKAEAKFLKQQEGLTWREWYDKHIYNGKDKQIKEYQKKYLNAYGFNRNKMPNNFDEWFNNLKFNDIFDIEQIMSAKGSYDDYVKASEAFYKEYLENKTEKATAKKVVKETAKETAKKSAFKIKQEYIDDFLKPYGFDADNLPHNLNVFMDKLSFGKKHQIKSLINQETGEKYSLNEAVKKFYEEKILGVKSKAVAKEAVKEALKKLPKEDGKVIDKIIQTFKSGYNKTEWYDSLRTNNLRKMREWCNEWTKKITSEEQRGVRIYTGDSYKLMNAYLRGQKTADEVGERIINSIDMCASALEKASTTRDMIVRRGDDYNMLEELGVDFSKANLENIKGSPLIAKSFFSASPDPHGGFDKSIEYIVKVPKGSQAMYVDSISINEGEKELLINRGGRYILEDVEYYDDNKTPKKIYMTLINLQSKA